MIVQHNVRHWRHCLQIHCSIDAFMIMPTHFILKMLTLDQVLPLTTSQSTNCVGKVCTESRWMGGPQNSPQLAPEQVGNHHNIHKIAGDKQQQAGTAQRQTHLQIVHGWQKCCGKWTESESTIHAKTSNVHRRFQPDLIYTCPEATQKGTQLNNKLNAL